MPLLPVSIQYNTIQ